MQGPEIHEISPVEHYAVNHSSLGQTASHVRRPCSDFMDMLRRLTNCHIIIIIIIRRREM